MENKPVPNELLDLYVNMAFATTDLQEWECHTRTLRSVQVAVEYTIKVLQDLRSMYGSLSGPLDIKIKELKQLIIAS